MDTLVTHPLFGYRVNYRRILEIQTRLSARLLTREIRSYTTLSHPVNVCVLRHSFNERGASGQLRSILCSAARIPERTHLQEFTRQS